MKSHCLCSNFHLNNRRTEFVKSCDGLLVVGGVDGFVWGISVSQIGVARENRTMLIPRVILPEGSWGSPTKKPRPVLRGQND